MSQQALNERVWRIEYRTIAVRGQERVMRLVAFERGWLASVDTESGPTLGADRSPYLAAWRALQPLDVDLAEAMLSVGYMARPTDDPDQSSAVPRSRSRPSRIRSSPNAKSGGTPSGAPITISAIAARFG